MTQHPKEYYKSFEFLFDYSWKAKTAEQIIKEMNLPDFEAIYVEDGIAALEKEKKYTGYDMDQYIQYRLDQEDEDIPLHDDDIVYIERD